VKSYKFTAVEIAVSRKEKLLSHLK